MFVLFSYSQILNRLIENIDLHPRTFHGMTTSQLRIYYTSTTPILPVFEVFVVLPNRPPPVFDEPKPPPPELPNPDEPNVDF